MKKIFYTHLIFLLLQISAFAQNFWEYISHIPTSVGCMAINSNDHIFAGGFPNGYFRSTDGGGNWESLPLYARYPFCIEINSNNTIFVGQLLGVFRSEDNGDNWTEINNGLTNYFVFDIAFNTNNTVFLATRDSGIFRSTNNGDNWIQINIGLTYLNTRCLISNQNDDIFVGTTGGGVFRSTNNGDNWTQINNGLTNLYVECFAVNDSDNIFLGTEGGGVYRSTNNGDDWLVINNGLNNFIINEIKINSLSHIFVGTDGAGVFCSRDNGNLWIEINSGIDSSHFNIHILEINSGDYAFTGGSFVYRSVIPTTQVEYENDEFPFNYFLFQNYPNPFNPTTTIAYQISQTEFVTLKVYDILGRKIATLVNEEKPSGEYEVEFNTSSIKHHPSSGIYFYQIRAGDYSETKKMILIR